MNKIKVKKFLYSSSKIAVAILIVIGVLFLISIGYDSFQNYKKEQKLNQLEQRREQELDQLAQKKEWPDKTIDHINVKINLSTKWSDGKMSYIFKVNNYSNFVEATKDSQNPTLLMSFVDDNGFKVTEIIVPNEELSGKVNDDGKRVALIANTSINMTKEKYEKLAKWTVGWNF